MTNKTVKSRVCWVTKEAGGRESPPEEPRYSTAARFAEEKDKWPHEAWSLVLEFSGPLDETQNICDPPPVESKFRTLILQGRGLVAGQKDSLSNSPLTLLVCFSSRTPGARSRSLFFFGTSLGAMDS